VSPSAAALVGFAAWTLFLLALIAVLRGSLTLSGRRAANSFGVDGSDVSPFAHRLCRAHANCFESLPAFAALVLVALVTGHAEVTDPLAPWALGARVGQSTVHLVSTSSLAVQLRFAFFLVQFAIQVWWAWSLLALWLG
jgi:uncharacterized MAPEG superfamily protein